MEKRSNIFWAAASWLAIIILAIINTRYYLAWIQNCAAADAGRWCPTSFDVGFFYGASLVILVLITARVFDFTTQKSQIALFIVTIILTGISIVIGELYSDDTRSGASIILLCILPLAAICSLFFFCVGVGNKNNQDKIAALQIVLSIASKFCIFAPFILCIAAPRFENIIVPLCVIGYPACIIGYYIFIIFHYVYKLYNHQPRWTPGKMRFITHHKPKISFYNLRQNLVK